MPSYLIPQNPDFFDKWVRDASAVRQEKRIRAGSPWAGLTPDLDPNQAPPTAMGLNSVGLVARPSPTPGGGEVLMPDAGYTTVDVDNLPLTTTQGSHKNVILLGQFNRTTSAGAKGSGTEYDGPTLMALVGGDDLTAGAAELWRVLPSNGTWEQVPYNLDAADAAQEATSGREAMPDWAEFPAGAPARVSDTGNITEPVFVWCSQNDRVMVYPTPDPSGAGGALLIADGSYEPLTNQFGDNFRASTVEHFGGRLYFGNTVESGTRHRQRIRRTALFTADPLPTLPSSGAYDIRDFSGDLLRLEKMGDLMVAYFTDGTAFIRISDVATSPDRVQLLREKRGLLSTHAVTSVGNQEHFGIFDDGWYFLDPSGRWTEVGMINIDGKQTSLWKSAFYNLIDMDYRHRTVVNYDGKFIRIAFTAKTGDSSDPDNQEVWIFDPRGNRVFRDSYNVVCWGEANANIGAATKWNELVGSWADLDGTWLSLAAEFGLKNLNHGTTDGHVLVHNYDTFTQYNTAVGVDRPPGVIWEGLMTSGGSPTLLKTVNKIWVEQIESDNNGFLIEVRGNSTDGSDGGWVTGNSESIIGDITTLFQDFNFTSSQLTLKIGTEAPIQIRSIIADISVDGSEERLG